MIDFDHLVDALGDHIGTAGDTIRDVLMSMDQDDLTVLMQNLDVDQILDLLDATGLDFTTLSSRDFNAVLETIAEVVSEKVEQEEQGAVGEASSIES